MIFDEVKRYNKGGEGGGADFKCCVYRWQLTYPTYSTLKHEVTDFACIPVKQPPLFLQYQGLTTVS